MRSVSFSTNPSADEFLRQLILFIDSHGSELLSRKAAFKLQPRALEYLALRLEGLTELQCVKTSNPIRFLAGAVADLTDFLRMEKVQQFCSLVSHLKLYSSSQDVRDPTPVTFRPFKKILKLEIRGCDLSSFRPVGMDSIRPTVERIVCQNSLECLWHLLNPLLEDQAHWSELRSLSCIYNELVEIDDSLKTTENLTVLDLSRNQIFEAQNLAQLGHLTALDLSFNSIGSLGEIPMLSTLIQLFLQSNGISSLDGINSLTALESIDLRWNVLSCWSDIVKLRELSSLKEVALEGNPLSTSNSYRIFALACLQQPGETNMVILDETPISEVELRKVKKIVVSEDGRMEESAADVGPILPYASTTSWFDWSRWWWWCWLPMRRRPHQELSTPFDVVPEMSDYSESIRPSTARPPLKRIVDIPTTSYVANIERSGDLGLRMTPTAMGRRSSRDFTISNGSYEGLFMNENVTS
eukprot:g6202.t1